MRLFKKGMIISWYGVYANIPKGWVACNGTNDTPDLRSRFLRGAGSGVSFDETGGSSTHVHGLYGTHTHSIVGGSGIMAGANYSNTTANPSKGTDTQSQSTLPLYHALWYIMKM